MKELNHGQLSDSLLAKFALRPTCVLWPLALKLPLAVADIEPSGLTLIGMMLNTIGCSIGVNLNMARSKSKTPQGEPCGVG